MMVKCPFCQITHVDNTIFCSECGYYLLSDEERETDRLDKDETGWMGTTKSPEAKPLSALGVNPLTIRLRIGQQKRIVEAQLDKIIHIGRLDPHLNIYPEIDVTDDIAPEKSVSRRHARILKQGSQVIIEDLGSINGTFINSKKLDPYLPETLDNGDTLQLGTLQIEIEIIK